MLEAVVAVVMIASHGIIRHFQADKVLLILVCSLIWYWGKLRRSFILACVYEHHGKLALCVFIAKRITISGIRHSIASRNEYRDVTHKAPELLVMLCILLFIDPAYAGSCFIGFAIGESLGASVLRIAGGIFTKIADIGLDLMKIVFNIKEDDARNPGVIADCTGDNAGDSLLRVRQMVSKHMGLPELRLSHLFF